ncbi:capsule biosynthesis protein [Paracoccus binzhouensis]|uniref:capsule biosynthesis protein n=1 Tax=Paracoccus binzhouensis TaxID=2796149 RepID=UPI001E6037F3|nr:capsule biosynthesis protein [Paracoccus binzhouensis]
MQANHQPPAMRPQSQPIPVRPMGQAVAQPAPRPMPAVPPTAVQPIRPPVGLAQPRRRHWLLLASFLLLVALPTALWAWYLWARASDQYVSTVGFSVRKEQSVPSIDLLGGLSSFAGSGGGSASDTDILYEYIRSQDMVERIDAELDLRTRFSRDWPHDFVFAFDPEGHIEDLTEYWQRQVKVLYDSSTALITLNVSAFTPEDAQQIAAAVFTQSSDKINELSAIAQDDATRLAKQELDKAREELTATRQAMTAFRMRSQIVDPEADLAGQMGVLSGLQAQLAEALVAHDLLIENAQPTDHRVIQSQQKIDALRRLIDAERSKFGAEGQGPAGESYAQLMAEYEKLAVDREFAEGAYRTARIAYETALAEAQRQSRYLAAHIEPKVAQSSTEPNRPWLLLMVAGMLLTGWSILVLIYYSIRDRG